MSLKFQIFNSLPFSLLLSFPEGKSNFLTPSDENHKIGIPLYIDVGILKKMCGIRMTVIGIIFVDLLTTTG